MTRKEKINVVFLTPPVTMEERYGALAASGNCTPCLASTILASITRQAGYPTHVIDAAAEGLILDEVMERLIRISPDFVGFTTTTLTTLPAERLAKHIKERWPHCVIGIGGPHATAIPEETLQRCPAFDFAAIHEGDETILDILNSIQNGDGDVTAIPGIACRAGEGTVAKTPPRPPFRELDTLPFPAWDLLNEYPHK
ncbi:hypothetical protein GF373_00535, partial [bacterium]|nr:hypothetical protein [bacterium]